MNVTLVKSNNFIRFTNTNGYFCYTTIIKKKKNLKKLRRPPPGNPTARSATFLMKLSASGVEPTFSQGKVTYLTIGLLRQLNVSTNIKVILKWNVCT
ncbi:hypothetical protein PFBG_06019 [Plasmodium falciparum 7G8]|uniref:Uncharacterized protein n=1 Tax=Plasmodium falciparum (isolate 7G8) TaxID=57266 RepID=W7ESX6_PLAF8|nr:hypothetical protein PFBG_06019 [Plasmodium falciparum 7G8]